MTTLNNNLNIAPNNNLTIELVNKDVVVNKDIDLSKSLNNDLVGR